MFISLVYISKSRITRSNDYSIYSLKEQADYFPKWLDHFIWSFPGGSDGKESACKAGDLGSVPGLGRSPGGGHGSPLQYSCLENPHGRGVWQACPWGRMGSQRVRHDGETNTAQHISLLWLDMRWL